MDKSQIKDICLEGSKAYYQFLASKRNGGVEEIEITRIEKISNDTYKLLLDRKLFELDAINFLYNGNFKAQFSNDKIAIKVYDNDKRALIVKVSEEIIPIISDLNNANWKVISDLKFLVQRVIDWYQVNGNNIDFNPEVKLDNKFDSTIFMDDPKPSDEQKKAIDTIFREKLCYIWGAPGTGKTRFVLSYSLLHYIYKNKKTLVLAPTNVALEQVMTGVMEVLIKAGVNHNKIIRLGYPSKEFADKYGEICETLGLEKELKKVSDQISIISSILGIKTEKQEEIEANIELVKETELALINKHNNITKERQLKDNLLKEETELKRVIAFQDTLSQEKTELIKRKNSIITKLLSSLTKKIDYDKEIDAIIDKEIFTENKIKSIKERIREIKLDQKLNIQQLEENQLFYNQKISILKEKGIIEGVNQNQLPNIIKTLISQLNTEIESNLIYKSLSKEYEKFSEIQLKELLQRLMEDKKKLESYSLYNRIESSLLIGATIDTYLYRFKEKELNVAHIFIDEAGYASIVKALTVFTLNAPVTLLGDHMQLPPVCELSKSDILGNDRYKNTFVWDQSSIFIGDYWRCNDRKEVFDIYINKNDPSDKSISRSSLTYSYRFGPNLAQTLSQYVYTIDGFKSRKTDNTEIVVCDVSNPPMARLPGSRLNEAEAQCIKKYVTDNYSVTDSIAILAPYRDQIKRLKQIIPELKDENIILTVHKSQGREWDTVIYSVCDIDNGLKPWFTDSLNNISNGIKNINTAVSRAKNKLIIFCNKESWKQNNNQLIAGLINSSTRDLKYNLQDIEIDSSQFVSFKNSRGFKQSNNLNRNIFKVDSEEKMQPDQWESPTLYWSRNKLAGYKYSANKNAWWKKKENID